MYVAPQIASTATAPGSASAKLVTAAGPLEVEWTKTGSHLVLTATIPVGALNATVSVPTSDPAFATIYETSPLSGAAVVWTAGAFVHGSSGVLAASIAEDHLGVVFSVESGQYNFSIATNSSTSVNE